MAKTDILRDLALLTRSRYGLIYLDTQEEPRASALLRHLADRLSLNYFSWFPTKGLRRAGFKDSVYQTSKVGDALTHVSQSRLPSVYHFHELGDYIEDKAVLHRLKDAVKQYEGDKGVLIVTGHGIDFPTSIRPMMATVKMPEPHMGEYKDLLKRILRDLSKRMRIKLEITQGDLNKLLNNLKGMTLMEAEKILTRVIVEDGKLSAKDIRKVMEAKKNVVEQEGLLEYYPVEDNLEAIADLKGLKSWLAKRKQIIANPERAKKFGLTFPKGVLLLGVQGCGKSLCAKAIAMGWGLPLLKFDPSNLYNKYIGESEKNFKRAMKTSERMAPVVLWIDEIEKAFSGSDSGDDGGVSTRVLGSFLTWMQDKKKDVFVVATANNIDKLPPEFLRKGRFDEIFFVDLPTAEARAAIFEIHLKKRKRNPKHFDLPTLVKASAGFSGAEIEQAIVSALYTAFSEGSHLSSEILLKEIQQTRPLSQTMREKVEKLRAWAQDRAVSAH